VHTLTANVSQEVDVIVYVMLVVSAVLAFLCISHIIPGVEEASLARVSASEQHPIRKYTFPSAD